MEKKMFTIYAKGSKKAYQAYINQYDIPVIIFKHKKAKNNFYEKPITPEKFKKLYLLELPPKKEPKPPKMKRSELPPNNAPILDAKTAEERMHFYEENGYFPALPPDFMEKQKRYFQKINNKKTTT